MTQDSQRSSSGHNPEEHSTESSLEGLNEEQLLTVTGGIGPGGIGAIGGGVVGTGAVGTGVAMFDKSTGVPTDQAVAGGVIGGAFGSLVGAGAGFLAGNKVGELRKAAKIAKAVK